MNQKNGKNSLGIDKCFEETNNPIELFEKWFEKAKEHEINDPNALALATSNQENQPNVRMVLLKGLSSKGFVFYTNFKSKKGKEIEVNKKASMCFHWKSLRRQVRILGNLEKVEDKEADEYYNSRPKGSRIGAWASKQSEELDDRSTLLNRVEEYEKKFEKTNISRPAHWNGYLVNPNLIEFWQDMPFRLHDRVEFKKQKDSWISRKLYP